MDRIVNDRSGVMELIDMVSEYASHRHRVTLVMGRNIYRQYEASVSLIHPERTLPNPGTTGIGMPIGLNTRVIMNLSLDCYVPGVVYVVNGDNVFRAQSPVSFDTTRDYVKHETVTRFTESYGYFCGNDPGFKIAVREGASSSNRTSASPNLPNLASETASPYSESQSLRSTPSATSKAAVASRHRPSLASASPLLYDTRVSSSPS